MIPAILLSDFICTHIAYDSKMENGKPPSMKYRRGQFYEKFNDLLTEGENVIPFPEPIMSAKTASNLFGSLIQSMKVKRLWVRAAVGTPGGVVLFLEKYQ